MATGADVSAGPCRNGAASWPHGGYAMSVGLKSRPRGRDALSSWRSPSVPGALLVMAAAVATMVGEALPPPPSTFPAATPPVHLTAAETTLPAPSAVWRFKASPGDPPGGGGGGHVGPKPGGSSDSGGTHAAPKPDKSPDSGGSKAAPKPDGPKDSGGAKPAPKPDGGAKPGPKPSAPSGGADAPKPGPRPAPGRPNDPNASKGPSQPAPPPTGKPGPQPNPPAGPQPGGKHGPQLPSDAGQSPNVVSGPPKKPDQEDGGSTASKFWNFVKPTPEDGIFTTVGAGQSLLGSAHRVATVSEAAAANSRDIAAVQRSIVNDPNSSPDMKIRAAHAAETAERTAWQNSSDAAKRLGPAKILPPTARKALTKAPWDAMGDAAKAAGKELPGELSTVDRFVKPVAKQIPYAGALITAGQSYFDVRHGGKSWQRATAEGVGSLVGGALGALGAGAAASVVPVAGTAVGLAAGGALGSYGGGKLADGIVNLVNTASGSKY